MGLIVAAIVLAVVEVIMNVLMRRVSARPLRRREATGSSEPVTMGSNPVLVAYFIYHLPILATIVASDRFGEHTKALAVYVGTPLLYLALFAVTGKHGLGWHR